MPFTSVTNLDENPDVRIFFTGLMIIDPNPDPDPRPGVNTCEVFVHRVASDHHLTVEVRRKRPGKPDIIMMRHTGQLEFMGPPGATTRFGMTIGVSSPDDPAFTPAGVRRYDPAPNTTSLEGRGFGFAIDIEGPQFHNRSVGRVDTLGGRPSIFFNDAVFYTAVMSNELTDELEVKLKRNNDVVVEDFPPFATIIGANIYLDDPDTIVSINWREQGRDHVLNLMKPEGGVSYEIYIANEPLFEDDDPQPPRHEEFSEYYKILPEVAPDEQFALDIPPLPAGEPRGSTTTPCMTIVKGGGGP